MQTVSQSGSAFCAAKYCRGFFRFVALIWGWSLDPTKVLQTPWQSWLLWKQIMLALVGAGVAWVICKAVKVLWESSERTLAAFAGLLAPSSRRCR